MKRTGFLACIALLLFLCKTEPVSGQVVVQEGTALSLTPLQFVQTYLVGTGVTITNALYNGSAEPLDSPNRLPLKYRDQIGNFTSSGNAQSELGLGGGVILSTGYTGKCVTGANPNDDMQGINQPAESDPDLVILAGGSTINDKSVLEFDFIPQTDVVTFRYVFGSIEFDGFCGSINDAFGLFLSGPGIGGGLGFANDAVNIALLPNSTNYVNIFNICDADQGNLGMGVYSWWNAEKRNYSYNRLTYVFTASYTVQCNQTYHMKFAIGDASDGVLDSGVFLEQNSFSSNNVTSATNFSNPLTGQLLVEGCSNATLSYSIPQAHTSDLIIDLAIKPSGTAGQADILPNPFPIHAIIPAGQLSSAPIVIIPVPDGTPEGPENLVIEASTTTCAVTNLITTEMQVKDYNPPVVTMQDQTICDGSSATLNPVITGGQPVLPENEFGYLWSTGATTQSIVATPGPGVHTFGVTVTDACNQTASVQSTVSVGTTPGAAGPVTGSTPICTPASGLVYSVPSIAGADSYLWTLPAGGVITAGANTNSITVNFSTSVLPGLITVAGHSDMCGDGTSSSLSLTINPAAPAAGPVTGPASLCQGPLVQSYSIPPLNFVSSYEWTFPAGVTILSGAGTNAVTCTFGTTAVSGQITARGINAECGPGPMATLDLIVDPLPGPAGTITTAATTLCTPEMGIPFSVGAISHATTYLWNYTGTWGNIVNNGPQLLADFPATSTGGTLTVTGSNGCGTGTVSPPMNLNVNPKPNVSILSPGDLRTTKNGRPILLRSGRPLGTNGTWSGTGVTETSPGNFVFDPADNAVTGGGTSNAIPYTLTYTYSNVFNCTDAKTLTVRVFGSNGGSTCPGTVSDVRDGRTYPTFMAGTGPTGRCWTASNLDYGNFLDAGQSQSDNFVPEKYCRSNVSTACDNYGAFYQWDEIMEHQQNPAFQDLCMPGFHVATPQEWQWLIDASLGVGLAGNTLKDMFKPNGFQGSLDGMMVQSNQWVHQSGPAQGAMYWTSQTSSAIQANARGLNFTNASVSMYPASRNHAFQVRCVRNSEP